MLIYQNLATVALIFSIFCHRYEYFDNLKNLLNEDFKFIYKRFILFWGAKQSYVILAECAALWAAHPARKGGLRPLMIPRAGLGQQLAWPPFLARYAARRAAYSASNQ